MNRREFSIRAAALLTAGVLTKPGFSRSQQTGDAMAFFVPFQRRDGDKIVEESDFGFALPHLARMTCRATFVVTGCFLSGLKISALVIARNPGVACLSLNWGIFGKTEQANEAVGVSFEESRVMETLVSNVPAIGGDLISVHFGRDGFDPRDDLLGNVSGIGVLVRFLGDREKVTDLLNAIFMPVVIK